MTFLRSLEKRDQPTNPAIDDDAWYQDYYISRTGFFPMLRQPWAGVHVDDSVALTISAVWACVRLVAEVMGSLPLITYQRQSNGGKKRATGHPLYRLLHDEPNPEMTASTFKETSQMHQEIRGNSYAEIERDYAGNPLALWPLRPDRMTPTVTDGGKLEYRYVLPNGKGVILPPHRVFHVRAFSYDGITGISPIAAAREEIGLAVAMQRFGGAFFRNGATPQGIIKHPETLTPTAQENITSSWYEQHGGLTRAQRIAILEEGMEYQQIGIAPEEAQFLGSRAFELRDVARFFRVPPHMIGDLADAHYNNIEHSGIEFVVYKIRPIGVRWEQEVRAKLIKPADRGTLFSEYLLDALLRGDWESRSKALEVMRRNGVINANDWARLENLDPIGPAGDIYLIPMNMVQLDDAGNDITPPDDDGGDTGQGRLRRFAAPQRALPAGRSSDPRARNRIRTAYKRIILQTADRAIRREVVDLRKIHKKHLGQRQLEDFEEAMQDLYRDHVGYLVKNFQPVFTSLAEAIQAAVADEIGGEAQLTEQLEVFAGDYTMAMATEHARSQQAQLQALIRDTDPEELDEAILERLEEWEEKEAGKITAEHHVRAADAMARQAFALAGVTKLVWVAQGAKVCPYCSNLDGNVVGIEKHFVPAGDFQPEGIDEPMHVYGAKYHPPLHAGCACTIVAG